MIPRINARSTRSTQSLTLMGYIKQILIFGFGAWFIISILYYISYFVTGNKSNLTSKPTLHPTLKIKHNTDIDNNFDTLVTKHHTSQDIQSKQTSHPKLSTKYGHPSKEDMSNPCIVILTYNRPKQLKRTIDSLKSIEGVTSYQIYISQDGNLGSTTNMIKNDLSAIPYKENKNNDDDKTIIKHIQHQQARHVRDPTAKLAVHYKFMFNVIFNEMDHSHAIILEDDMIFSQDFLEYFASTVYLLNDDSNELFCISSWNDYGQNFLNHNDEMLYRTDYFPGLGWLLKKELWINEIESLFPEDHWDHFMRIDTITKNRDCIYPDISRNYNIGEIGSTMDGHWYNQYLRPMQFYKESHVRFRDLDLSYLEKKNYEQYIIDIFTKKSKFVGIFPRDSSNIYQQLKQPDINKYGNFLLIAYYGWNWQQIANRIGVLETQRTRHQNTIFIKKNNVMYIFANIRLSPYLKYNADLANTLSKMNIKNERMQILTGNTGQSCSKTCQEKGLECLEDHFEYVNHCSVLYKYFGCESGCLGGQVGEDVPNYVAARKPGLYQKCLTTDFPPKCKAKHPTTARICPCA